MQSKQRFYSTKHNLLTIDQQYLSTKKRSLFDKSRLLVCGVLVIVVIMLLISSLIKTSSPIPAAIQVTSSDASLPPITTVKNSFWKQQTLALIDKTHIWNGTYDGDFAPPLGSLDPYTTYYATLLYKTLGVALPNKDQSIQALRAMQKGDGHFSCETDDARSSTVDQADCIFYLTLSLSNLGSLPRDKTSIINHLNSLETSSGLFAPNASTLVQMNKDDSRFATTLTATNDALSVLQRLDAKPARQTQLQHWLISHWLQGAPKSESTFLQIDYLAGIAQALHTLGIAIPQIATHNAQINATCQQIIDLTHPQIGQQTDLFFIWDCAHLHEWVHMTSNGTLFTPSFFARLKTFQQHEGGFNSFFLNQPAQPDIQGTSIFVSLLQSNQQVISQRAAILALLHLQMIDQGGFFVVQTMKDASPLSIELSLQMYDLLDGSPARKSTVRTAVALLMNHISSTEHVEDIYYTLLLSKELDLPTNTIAPLLKERATEFVQRIPSNQPLSQRQLQDAYYFSLMLVFNQPADQKIVADLLAMSNTHGGFAPMLSVATLETTWQAASILMRLSPSSLPQYRRQQLYGWILQKQNSTGGFTEVGVTNIYSSYAAIEALLSLGDKTFDTFRLSTWLGSLENTHGGMSPDQSSHEPTFAATYLALTIAQQLHISL